MANISIDLETLGLRASAVVLTIGAVAFDEENILFKFRVNLDIDEQLALGRTIDGSVLRWWFEQSTDARNGAIVAPEKILSALNKFSTFIGTNGKNGQVWANGQDFDIGIINDMYDSLRLPRPWKYNAARDMRTLVQVYGGKPDSVLIPFDGEKHEALADAQHQAKLIQFMLKEIDRERNAGKTAKKNSRG